MKRRRESDGSCQKKLKVLIGHIHVNHSVSSQLVLGDTKALIWSNELFETGEAERAIACSVGDEGFKIETGSDVFLFLNGTLGPLLLLLLLLLLYCSGALDESKSEKEVRDNPKGTELLECGDEEVEIDEWDELGDDDGNENTKSCWTSSSSSDSSS